jgi:hypothetical protein
VEAKSPTSAESILKPLLQAFAYTSLIAKWKDVFLECYGLDKKTAITPAILTFASSLSGKQLSQLRLYPNFQKLIKRLNEELTKNDVTPIRFFVVNNPIESLKECITIQTADKTKKPVFCNGLKLSVGEIALP